MKVCKFSLLFAAAACSSEAAAPSDPSGAGTSGKASGGGVGSAAGAAGSSAVAGGMTGGSASNAGSSSVAVSSGVGGGPAGSSGAGGGSGASGAAGSGGASGSAGTAGGADPGAAATLQGLTLQVKCGAVANQERSCNYLPPGDANCGSNRVRAYAMASKKMGGTPGAIYDVTLRVRGIVEANVYTGGSSDMNGFYTGGMVGGNEGGAQYSQYSLQVSSPATTYRLNQLDPGAQQDKYKNPTNGGVVHHFGFMIDYRETIKIEGGATVSLKGEDNDCLMGRNCKPPANDFGHCELQKMDGLTEDQVPQGASGFDGNFIWIDVEKATISQ